MPTTTTVMPLGGLTPACPGDAQRRRVQLPADVTYRAGTVLAEAVGASGIWIAYTPRGTNPARMLLEFDCLTDSGGNHWLGLKNDGTGPVGQVAVDDVPAFVAGTFRTSDLVLAGPGALDEAAVAALGRLVEGTLSNGLLRLP